MQTKIHRFFDRQRNSGVKSAFVLLGRALFPHTVGHALVLYFAVMVALSSVYWAHGVVLAPYMPNAVGTSEDASSSAPMVYRHSDYFAVFIPEVDDLLNGARSGLFTLWSSETEFGRPTYQTSGYSPVFLPGFVFGQLTDNPYVYLTLLAWCTVVLFGMFVILLGCEWELDPFATLIAGLLCATMPYMMLWMTFNVFISGLCWTTAILYGVVRYQRRRDVYGWGILTFAVSSLFLTGYPQTIVYIAYMLAGFCVVQVVRAYSKDRNDGIAFCAGVLSAVAVGVALVVPVYADILVNARDSSRIDAGYEFFSHVVLSVTSWQDVATLIARYSNQEFYGEQLRAGFPFQSSAEHMTPMLGMFALIGLWVSWRRDRYWLVVIAVLCAVALIPAAHYFAFSYLGFNLSKSSPVAFLKYPLVVLVLYGADAVVRTVRRSRTQSLTIAAACAGVVSVGGSLWAGQTLSYDVVWLNVLIAAMLISVVWLQLVLPVRGLLWVGILVSILMYSYPMLLWQPATIRTVDDAYYERIRRHIPAGALTAVVPGNIPFVGNNFNAFVDIPSIHTYNSLSAQRYQQYITTMGGEFTNYGRRNASINPDFAGLPFWMSNIGLVVTPIEMRSPVLQKVDSLPGKNREQTFFLYSVTQRMGRAIVVAQPAIPATQQSIEISDPRSSGYQTPGITENVGDRMTFSVSVNQSSLLVVSQKYHPQWIAEVFDGQRWTERPVITVNGLFQGVALTPDVTTVRLTFRPYAAWMWVVHLFWALYTAYIGFVWVRTRQNQRSNSRMTDQPTVPSE